MANLSKIKYLAEKRGISIRELAERVGLGENRIHVMCRTNSTKIDTLEKIAKELCVPVSIFFDDDTQVTEIKSTSIHTEGDYSPASESGAVCVNAGSASEADLREQIAQLKSQLADKERIIQLLERH